MTYRELLEAAALAAGGYVYVQDMGWIESLPDGSRGAWWNPLDDDGDALRLGVDRNMEMSLSEEDQMAKAYIPGAVQGYACDYLFCDGDKRKAMRRAIVECAAASIGKTGEPT